jgi:hypothetical protein
VAADTRTSDRSPANSIVSFSTEPFDMTATTTAERADSPTTCTERTTARSAGGPTTNEAWLVSCARRFDVWCNISSRRPCVASKKSPTRCVALRSSELGSVMWSTKKRYPLSVGTRPADVCGWMRKPSCSSTAISLRTVAELTCTPGALAMWVEPTG